MNGDELYDAVIVATPAHVAGELLDGVDHELARNLLEITYSSSVTVTLGYYKQQLAKLPPGLASWCLAAKARGCWPAPSSTTNFLIARRRTRAYCAASWAAHATRRCSALNDDEMLKTVRQELHEHRKAGFPADLLARLPLARSHGAVRARTHCARGAD